jgi:hypothetical protein
METSAPTARAGFALACALLALAVPWPGRSPEPCRHPRLRASGEVVCDASAGPRLAGPARRLFGLPIDPNCADLVTLETLPGIGPARARAIADERRVRPFASLDELQRVRGLGPVRVGALAPWVEIDSSLAACDAASVKSRPCRSSCGNAGVGQPP